MNMKKMLREAFPFFIGVPALVWQTLFFYVPLFFVIFMAFRSFSFASFAPFFASIYGAVIVRTLILAMGTACTCLLIAYPVAYWIAFNGKRWKNVLLFFLFIPFWTNFLLHVYAWMFVLERGGVINLLLQNIGIISEPLRLLNSLFAVGLIMVYCYLPFMILPIYTSLEKFDYRFMEASSDLGGTWWQTVWRIIIPSSWPGIRSGFFLVFVPAFGEFVIPELVGGDKIVFVGNIVTHYTLSANTASLGAAFTILTSLVLLSVVALLYVFERKIFTRS